MIRWSLIFFSLLASCIGQTASQAVPEEQLTVRVSYEDDRRASANLSVELFSTYGSSIETRVTDGFGSVIFSRLQPAKYKLRISGIDIVTTETGEIDMTESGPNATEYVTIPMNRWSTILRRWEVSELSCEYRRKGYGGTSGCGVQGGHEKLRRLPHGEIRIAGNAHDVH